MSHIFQKLYLKVVKHILNYHRVHLPCTTLNLIISILPHLVFLNNLQIFLCFKPFYKFHNSYHNMHKNQKRNSCFASIQESNPNINNFKKKKLFFYKIPKIFGKSFKFKLFILNLNI
jgi:hypothetical protein